MKHFIVEIQQDSSHLSPEIREHIKTCSACRREYECYQKIEKIISSIPMERVPDILRARIITNVLEPKLQPLFNLWSYIVPIVFLLLTPLIISYLNRVHIFTVSTAWLLILSIFFTIWGMVMILVCAAQILQQHSRLILKMEHHLTGFMTNKANTVQSSAYSSMGEV